MLYLEVILKTNSWFMPPAAGANHSFFKFHPEATDNNKTGGKWVLNYELDKELTQIVKATIVN
jgi:hypothetical protein